MDLFGNPSNSSQYKTITINMNGVIKTVCVPIDNDSDYLEPFPGQPKPPTSGPVHVIAPDSDSSPALNAPASRSLTLGGGAFANLQHARETPQTVKKNGVAKQKRKTAHQTRNDLTPIQDIQPQPVQEQQAQPTRTPPPNQTVPAQPIPAAPGQFLLGSGPIQQPQRQQNFPLVGASQHPMVLAPPVSSVAAQAAAIPPPFMPVPAAPLPMVPPPVPAPVVPPQGFPMYMPTSGIRVTGAPQRTSGNPAIPPILGVSAGSGVTPAAVPNRVPGVQPLTLPTHPQVPQIVVPNTGSGSGVLMPLGNTSVTITQASQPVVVNTLQSRTVGSGSTNTNILNSRTGAGNAHSAAASGFVVSKDQSGGMQLPVKAPQLQQPATQTVIVKQRTIAPKTTPHAVSDQAIASGSGSGSGTTKIVSSTDIADGLSKLLNAMTRSDGKNEQEALDFLRKGVNKLVPKDTETVTPSSPFKSGLDTAGGSKPPSTKLTGIATPIQHGVHSDTPVPSDREHESTDDQTSSPGKNSSSGKDKVLNIKIKNIGPKNKDKASKSKKRNIDVYDSPDDSEDSFNWFDDDTGKEKDPSWRYYFDTSSLGAPRDLKRRSKEPERFNIIPQSPKRRRRRFKISDYSHVIKPCKVLLERNPDIEALFDD